VTRRAASLLAAATLVASLLGTAPPVAAAVPTAVDDAGIVVQRDAPAATVDVLANDSVAAEATISDVTDPDHGTVAIAADGRSVTYAPDTGYTGADTFDYTVTDPIDGPDSATVTIKVNAPPVAVADPSTASCWYLPSQTFALPEDKTSPFEPAAACNLLANDSDADGTIVDFEIVDGPDHGTVANLLPLVLPGISADFSYTPDANFTTPVGDWISDSFTYRAIDDDGARSAPATVRLWVAPVNDAPTFVAGPATVHGRQGTAFSAPWASSISPGNAFESGQTVHFVGQGAAGVDQSLFSAPPAISATGVLTFTPAPGHSGSRVWTFRAVDDGGLEDYGGGSGQPVARDTSDPVTITITVDADHPPVATDDTLTVAEDSGAAAVDVLANDSDEDLDDLTVTAVTQGAKGSVVIVPGGSSLSYTPDPGAFGPDTFTYTVSDGQGGTDVASVAVTITSSEDGPTAGADAATVTEDQAGATTVAVRSNDTDPDGDPLTVIAKTDGAKGAVTITAGGAAVTYKPYANKYGADSFTYTISDGNGGTDVGTVNVTISAVNDPPNAVNDGVPTPFKVYRAAGARSIPVLANDTWLPDATETLKITAVSQGRHGVVRITGGGTGLTYSPSGSTLGIDVFTYTISDGHGGTDRASVQVTVAADATAPKATITAVSSTAISGSTNRAVTVTWALTETQSGVRSQQLQRRRDSGAWVNVTLASASTRTMTFTLSPHHLYAFRVRATDKAGNIGSWAGRSYRI
jgi:hypothetical protein